MNNDHKNIDEAFREGLDGHEEKFDPQAWDQMLGMLEENHRVWPAPIPFYKSKPFKRITIMTLLGIVLTGWFYFGQPSNQHKVSTSAMQSSNTVSVPNASAPVTTIPPTEITKSAAPVVPATPSNYSIIPSVYTATFPAKVLSSVPTPEPEALKSFENYIYTLGPKDFSFKPLTVNAPDGFGERLEQVFGRPKKKYRYNGPWIGIHFAYAAPIKEMRKQGYGQGWGGNMELMSGDLVKSKQLGVFLGGDFGVMYHGSGNTNGVMLQTPNNDSGYTYLYNMSFQANFIARFEFGNYRLKPYFDVNLGIRGLNTYQRIDTKKDLQGFEASDLSVTSNWGLQMGASAGLRYHLVPGVSLDGRVTWYSGDQFTWSDLSKSSYKQNTGTYNVVNASSGLDMLHFRLGFLFDINEMRSNRYEERSSGWHSSGPVFNGGGGGGSSPKELKIQLPRK